MTKNGHHFQHLTLSLLLALWASFTLPAEAASPKTLNLKPNPTPAVETNQPEPTTKPLNLLPLMSLLTVLEMEYIIFLLFKGRNLSVSLELERKQNQQIMHRLENQAFYDTLTQLPNRRLFRERLLQNMKLAHRQKSRFCIMMADLDKFKPINDNLGHEAGDTVLKEVANRLQMIMRESDTVARFGGDEFAFICPSLQDRAAVSTLCMRILVAMQQPFIILGQKYSVGISLGISVYPDHAVDEEMLVRRADTALYRAKEKRNTFVIYDRQFGND